MSIREAEPADAERINEVARSAMTASYGLSPEQIETISDEQFSEESVERKTDASDTVLLVVESDEDGAVVGVAEGDLGEGRGEVRWLFVDPERRGAGHGTDLFEAAADELRERGARDVQAVTLAINREGPDFFERFGLEQVDDRESEIGSETVVEQIFVESDEADGDEADDGGDGGDGAPATEDAGRGEGEDEHEEATFPDDGVATTEDGTTVYVSEDDPDSGTKGPFFKTFTDEAHEDRYGYYCGSCGSTETIMGDMEHIECQNCGNSHEPKGSEQYDEGYL